MTRSRDDILNDIHELVQDITRDDRHTLQTLALLRNGHPKAARTDTGTRTLATKHVSQDTLDSLESDGTSYGDPVGEWAIRPDHAVTLGRAYQRAKHNMLRAGKHADSIRRKMMTIDIKRTDVPDPQEWCVNCLPHGYCNPRTKNRGRYCDWCRTIWHTWGFYPPAHIIHLHESGDRTKLLPALQEHKKKK